MNTFDIIIAALLLFGFIRGFMKGLFVELASLASLILGIYGAIHFSDAVGHYLKQYVEWEEDYITIGAFAITFIGIVVLVALIGKLFTKIANIIALGILNKILGGAFGLLKYCLIVSIILIVFDKINAIFPISDKSHTENSMLYEPVKGLAPSIFSGLVDMEKIDIQEHLGELNTDSRKDSIQ